MYVRPLGCPAGLRTRRWLLVRAAGLELPAAAYWVDPRHRAVHTRGVWSVELQEVSPRPGRTTVALGLRAFSLHLHVDDVSDNGADALPPLPATRPAPGDCVRDGQEQVRVSAVVLVGDSVADIGCAGELDHLLAVPAV